MTEILPLEKADTSVNVNRVPTNPHAAYIHIPFCRRRCYYCDFPIAPLGNTHNSATAIEEYVEVLCQEINATPALGQSLTTIFFGGGTPSLLPVQQLQRIIGTVEQQFGVAPLAEISMEIDPGTFDLNQLRGYQRSGVNRVSLGVQAFQDELLQVCGRSHTANDIFRAIDLIRQSGISNFSLDLISGLPHQTLEQWRDSLDQAIAIAPNHISGYDLVLEPDTVFGQRYQPEAKPLPPQEKSAQMYQLAQQKLTEAGYAHYEISNYAQPGYQCRHNRVYWENRPYYGFGMGAASYVHKQRFTRPRTRQQYFAWVQKFVEAGGVIDHPQTSATDELLETLMLGLRLAEGIDLSQIRQQFGQDIVEEIWDCLHTYTQQGWVEVLGKRLQVSTIPAVGRVRLSDPEGFLLSNTVLAALFEQLG